MHSRLAHAAADRAEPVCGALVRTGVVLLPALLLVLFSLFPPLCAGGELPGQDYFLRSLMPEAAPVPATMQHGQDLAPDASAAPGPRLEQPGEGREERLARRGIVSVEIRSSRLRLATAPFSGILDEVLVREGEMVKQDQPLARMESGREARALESAREALAGAVERMGAGEPGAGSAAEDKDARELSRLAGKVEAAEEALAAATLRAPHTARIMAVKALAGQYLKQGDPVCELARPDALEIAASVPSSWIRSLEPGHLIWVFVEETGRSYEARVVRLGGKVDPATRTLPVFAVFIDPGQDLLPGMSGRADFWPPSR